MVTGSNCINALVFFPHLVLVSVPSAACLFNCFSLLLLCHQGTSSRINYDPCLADAITKTNILVVEGYLFELPDTVRTISKVCEKARKCGALVAITASDVSCIERHYDDYW